MHHIADDRTHAIPTLAELSAEAAQLAHALSKLAARLPLARGYPPRAELDPAGIRRIIRLRRLRNRYFPAELFADPAWDILLDLTAAKLEGIETSVSSLCIAAAVPTTTGLRWISRMVDQGLLVRKADPVDRRRVLVQLTETAFDCMRACLVALQANGVPI